MIFSNYIYETNNALGKILNESKSESGLTTRGVKKGKLPVSDEYKLVTTYNTDDQAAHGDGNYETCANCDRPIKYVSVIKNDEGDEYKVGADCGVSITSGATKKAIQDFMKDEKKILKLVKDTLKMIDIFSQNHSAFVSMAKDLKLNLKDIAKMDVEDLRNTEKKLDISSNGTQALGNLIKHGKLSVLFDKIKKKDEDDIKAAIRRGIKDGAYWTELGAMGLEPMRDKSMINYL